MRSCQRAEKLIAPTPNQTSRICLNPFLIVISSLDGYSLWGFASSLCRLRLEDWVVLVHFVSTPRSLHLSTGLPRKFSSFWTAGRQGKFAESNKLCSIDFSIPRGRGSSSVLAIAIRYTIVETDAEEIEPDQRFGIHNLRQSGDCLLLASETPYGGIQ